MDIYSIIGMFSGMVLGVLASYALMAKFEERRRRLKDKFGYKFAGSGVIVKRVVGGAVVTATPLDQAYLRER